MVLKKFTCALKKFPNGSAERAMPPPTPAKPEKGAKADTHARRRQQLAQYQKYRVLEEDGICGVGQRLQHGDLMVNKHTPLNTRDDLPGVEPLQVGALSQDQLDVGLLELPVEQVGLSQLHERRAVDGLDQKRVCIVVLCALR